MMYLTTANIKKHIQQLKEQKLEAGIEAINDGKNWRLRIVPFDWRAEYPDDAMLLYMGSGKNRKVKTVKSEKSIFNLADRYGIRYNFISFKFEIP